VQAILGHSNVRTTMIYAWLSPDHLIGATGILDGLGSVFSPTSAQNAVAETLTAR
jgi:hypothetical protein